MHITAIRGGTAPTLLGNFILVYQRALVAFKTGNYESL